MISPTGFGIRNDKMGMGHYGSSRGGRKHLGVDFLADPFQEVIAPFSLYIERIATPNAKYSDLSGISWKTKFMTGQMFYFSPDRSLIGCEVREGMIIGMAQDLKPFYGPEIKSHIHFEIESFDPMILIKMREIWNK